MSGLLAGSPRAYARLAGALYIATGVTALIGEMFEVLVDGASRRPGQWSGRSSSNRILNFASPQPDLLGQYIQVRVTRAAPNSLVGEHVI